MVSILSVGCETKKQLNNNFATNNNFIMLVKYYDSAKIQRKEFYYNSDGGVLRDGYEVNTIKIDEKDKMEFIQFYKSLNLKSNNCWFPVKKEAELDFNYSKRYSLLFGSDNYKKMKCDSIKNEDRSAYSHLFFYLNNILQKTDEYRKAYPVLYEDY